MGGQLGELVVSLAADVSRFREDMGKAAKISNDTSRQMASNFEKMSNATSSAMKVAAGALGGFVIADFTRDIVQAGLAMEKMSKLFSAASGSFTQGAREMEYIRGVSNKMGLDFQSTAQSYGKFTAAIRGSSLEGERGRKIFESVSAASTALGLSVDETSSIFIALQQMMSKGKVQAEELKNQLGERLPGAFGLAAKAMGITTAELDKMLQDGKVLADDLLPKLAVELDKVYGKAAEEGAKGAQAEINRMNNAWRETKQIIGTELLPLVSSFAVGIRNASQETSGFIQGLKRDLKDNDFMAALDRLIDPIGEAQGDISYRVRRQAYGALGTPGTLETGKYTTLASRAAQVNAEAEKAAAESKKRAEEAAKAAKKVADELAKLKGQYKSAVTDINNELALMNPALDDHSKELLKVDQHYAKLMKQFEKVPGAVAALKSLREEIKKGIDTEYQKAEAAAMLDRLGNETGFAFAQGAFNSTKNQGFLNYKPRKNEYSLTGPGYTGMGATGDSSGFDPDARRDFINQFGSFEDQSFQYAVERVSELDDLYKRGGMAFSEYLASQEKEYQDHSDRMRDMETARAMTAASIMGGQMSQLGQLFMQGSKDQFEAGKALAIAGATIDTAAAAISAYKAMAGIPVVGPYLGAAAAGLAVTYGLAQIAMIESANYQPRAMGGAVTGGSTYLVGERGPELLTMGGNGYITPNSQLGGGKVDVTQVFQISTGVSETVRAELYQAMPFIRQQSVNAVHEAINGGTNLSRAVGRM